MSKVLASSSSSEHVDGKVVAEKEIGDNLPPGFYFLPSPSQLIEGYLVQKILGLQIYSNMVKVMDFVEHLDPNQLNLGMLFVPFRWSNMTIGPVWQLVVSCSGWN